MRQLPITPLCLLISLSASLPAWGISFQTRLESVEWKVEGDQFECRLSQPVTDFGAGEFVRRAGEQATFRLQTQSRWLSAGSATLLAAAAPWQPGRGDINLGRVGVSDGNIPFNSSQAQAGRLLAGLLDGRSPVVQHMTMQGGERVEVRLLPVKFKKAYNDYLACTTKLLAVNFSQVQQSRVGFPNGGVELDPLAEAKLEIILSFIKSDPSVNHILLEGHSDNSGSRLTNRDLSRRRAMAVMSYLEAHGVPAEQITLRFHGERYPLVPNNNPANRSKNRRVAITLEKLPETQATPPAAEPVSAKSDPAATS